MKNTENPFRVLLTSELSSVEFSIQYDAGVRGRHMTFDDASVVVQNLINPLYLLWRRLSRKSLMELVFHKSVVRSRSVADVDGICFPKLKSGYNIELGK